MTHDKRTTKGGTHYEDHFLYSDCGADFGFAETNGISGGLIASYDYVRGSDGRKHSRVRYEMHT